MTSPAYSSLGEFNSKLITACIDPDLPGNGPATIPIQYMRGNIYLVYGIISHPSSRGRVVKAMD